MVFVINSHCLFLHASQCKVTKYKCASRYWWLVSDINLLINLRDNGDMTVYLKCTVYLKVYVL